jgi:hypothetical protein
MTWTPHPRSLLARAEPRGPAPLDHALWRPSDPVPWCPLGTVWVSHPPDAHGPVANAHGPRGARLCRPHRRGRSPPGATAGRCEPPASRSRARAPQRVKTTLRLVACTHPCLPPRLAGAARSPRGHPQGAPDAAPGGPRGCRERATRLRGARRGGRQARQLVQHARALVGQGLQPTRARTRRPAGARRSGRLWWALGSAGLRTGPRGRPPPSRRQGATGRRQPTGAPRPQRGRHRPQAPAPSPAPPAPAPPRAPTAMPAPPLEACHPSLRRRGAADRRRPQPAAHHQARRPERGEVDWRGQHVVRVPLTTRPVPAVA